MPPVRRKRWTPQCKSHCIVWAVAMDGGLLLRCAHCLAVKKKIDLSATYTAELLRTQAKQSQAQHLTHCVRKHPYPSPPEGAFRAETE